MKKLLLLFAVLLTAVKASAKNYILYTSSDGEVVEPCSSNVFGASIVSNTYKNGQGKILFDGEVTMIGDDAFQYCSSLTSVVIPNSVTEIGDWVFSWCSGLTSVVIPNSVTTIENGAFYNCSGLTSVEIGNSVTWIGSDAFTWCGCLEEITSLNTTPPMVGGSCFGHVAKSACVLKVQHEAVNVYKYADGWKDFTNIEGITFNENYILYTSLDGEVIYPNSDAIDANIISNTYEGGLGKIFFDDEIPTIGNYAFFGNSNLTSVELPNSVIEIGYCAFASCYSLASVELPNSVTTIKYAAFWGCDLTSIEIPAFVKTIEGGAFYYCSSLESFIGKFVTEDHRCLIIDGELNAFAPAGLTSYVIPSFVTTIGAYAFGSCSSLTLVVIPESVTEIGYWAFGSCSSLTSIEIPNSVTTIGDRAFEACRSLKEITSLNTTPPAVYSYTFGDVDKETCVLKVPAESVEAYKATEGWKDFKNIVGIVSDAITVVKGETSSSKMYNLHGTEVPNGYRGIVIRGGKKILK